MHNHKVHDTISLINNHCLKAGVVPSLLFNLILMMNLPNNESVHIVIVNRNLATINIYKDGFIRTTIKGNRNKVEDLKYKLHIIDIRPIDIKMIVEEMTYQFSKWTV